jgi:hypothetical protein
MAAVLMMLPVGLLLRANADDSHARPLDPKELIVKVDDGKLFINDTRLRFPWSRKVFVDILRKPSRVLDKANTILIWDDLGILIHEDSENKNVKQFTVALSPQDFDFWPKKLFAGKLTIDNSTVTADATIEAINEKKRGEKFDTPLGGFTSNLVQEKLQIAVRRTKAIPGKNAEILIEAKQAD